MVSQLGGEWGQGKTRGVCPVPAPSADAYGRSYYRLRSTRRGGEELRAGMWRKDRAYSSSSEGGACCGVVGS